MERSYSDQASLCNILGVIYCPREAQGEEERQEGLNVRKKQTYSYQVCQSISHSFHQVPQKTSKKQGRKKEVSITLWNKKQTYPYQVSVHSPPTPCLKDAYFSAGAFLPRSASITFQLAPTRRKKSPPPLFLSRGLGASLSFPE